jgi:hypothetical protein
MNGSVWTLLGSPTLYSSNFVRNSYFAVDKINYWVTAYQALFNANIIMNAGQQSSTRRSCN